MVNEIELETVPTDALISTVLFISDEFINKLICVNPFSLVGSI